jgi:hypothetical protein
VNVIAGHVHRGIAPAEGGYTESDDKPLGNVSGKYRPHRPQWSVENESPAKQQFSMWSATRSAFTRAAGC